MGWQLTGNGVFHVSSYYTAPQGAMVPLSPGRFSGVLRLLEGFLSLFVQQHEEGFLPMIILLRGVSLWWAAVNVPL